MSIPEVTSWSRFLPQPPDEGGSLAMARGHAGQSILVTGAGGYIGSALVKAIAASGPRNIILLDSSEQSLFAIQRDLESAFSHVHHEALLGTVQDLAFVDGVFRRFHPEIVYHAAAFKHVPLLERNPFAALRNNAIGTYTLVEAAARHKTPKLVLISTDKAVNPHSIMGVSKRIAELAVVARSGAACRMNAIRMGNVIGSGGSVIPTFLQQIAERGPVTVTHPEVSRWFLSLRETVEAILACGMASCEGKILLPKLGEPVPITALAGFLIRMAGNGSTGEIPIVFTGLRPGEKLHEELVFKTEIREGCLEGPLEAINTRRLAVAEMEDVIEELDSLVASRDLSGLIRVLSCVVPEYVPSGFLR